jgi:hypothetical protein
MATQTKRMVIDFLVKDYKSSTHEVCILADGFNPATVKAQPNCKDNFVLRWYFSLQGEENPQFSETMLMQKDAKDQRIYRYDWAFGISMVQPFAWNWLEELNNDDAITIQILLEPVENAPDAIPVAATLSALSPSRNTQSKWDLSKISKFAADAAKIGAAALPVMDYISSGLSLTSNILESDTDGKKNWFLYQFFDEKLKCPAVEWRISKEVLKEYGTLLRGSLFLAFHGTPARPGHLRLQLRPQIRYCQTGDINYIAPTNKMTKDQQVFIEVVPN